jgi:hypothetical protein|uniref:Uncharacterized protein n=1 Tax=viral metagenome TaxID=1070528 RepID=A0A6C0F6F1_9ZZZZ
MEDPPKTRRELKKSAKEKKADVYSAKHTRIAAATKLKKK